MVKRGLKHGKSRLETWYIEVRNMVKRGLKHGK